MFSGIRARFGSKVDLITVYIEEAHPSDKNHFKGHIEIETHQNLQVMINKKTTLSYDGKESNKDEIEQCSVICKETHFTEHVI